MPNVSAIMILIVVMSFALIPLLINAVQVAASRRRSFPLRGSVIAAQPRASTQ